LLETIEPSQAVIDSCKKLKPAGYRIALDEFEDRPGYGPLINLADIIKIVSGSVITSVA
jgi:EAL and modified HD-GYP domain-containing signal transduction protein